MLPLIKKASQVHFLMDVKDSDLAEFKFIQTSQENSRAISLDRQLRINQVLNELKQKIEIRKVNIVTQNLLIVENPDRTICFLTPQNLDSVSLGSINSELPIFINAFDDVEKQYLSLFRINGIIVSPSLMIK